MKRFKRRRWGVRFHLACCGNSAWSEWTKLYRTKLGALVSGYWNKPPWGGTAILFDKRKES